MGIGLELARGLMMRGCVVVLGDVRNAEAAAAELSREGRAIGLEMDVTNDVQIERAMQHIEADLGGLDIVINNAGLFTTISRGHFENISIGEWEKVFAVNVTGVFRVVKAALPLLRRSRAGRIINITSATVFSAPPNLLHYVSTKGALTAMTRSMARELGDDGITVNAVAPGFTLSAGVLDNQTDPAAPQFERARMARAIKRDQMPGDLVGAAAFLASDDASFVTGQTLVVDGGSVMR
jgi:NAD(P)-dependent dehydrogenase (short-subunit alcohol dehydrogenase family)